MSNRIPDRWVKYTAFGKQIANTPFIALKCPLSEGLCKLLPPETRFGLEDVRARLPQVSLIIDLTNTKRYYNAKILNDYGIKHKKIFVPGHEIPDLLKFNQFFHVVDAFIANNKYNPDKIIGVHCTHGVNRTGLFICSYMISKLGYKYEEAIEEFSSARGYCIERQNYLTELKKYETNPLKFEPDSYIKQLERPVKYTRTKSERIEPLMQVPTPLIPPMLIPPPVPRKRGTIQSLMELPPPLMNPEFQFMQHHFTTRPLSRRPCGPAYVAPRRHEQRRIERPYRNPNRSKPY